MNDTQAQWLPFVFPVLFPAMWLAITTILGALSGWFFLQKAYPRGDDPALLTLRGRSGSMGIGVSMGGILTLSACGTGVRIGIWRLFGPFQRPFLVPWGDIAVESSRALFVPSATLRFGRSGMGRLQIDARTWERLAAFAPAKMPGMHVLGGSSGEQGVALLRQWAVITVAAGTFFAVVPRIMGGPPVPLAIGYAFPAIAFGLPQLFRWLRDRG